MEARDTVYVLAFHCGQPRFANWQFGFRFGEALGEPEVREKASAPPPVPEPLCDVDSKDIDKWLACWYELANPPGCHVWRGVDEWVEDPKWTGEGVDSLASGAGQLIVV